MKIKFRIALFFILIITLCKAGNFDITQLFKSLDDYRNPKSDGPQNVRGSINVIDCKSQARGYYENTDKKIVAWISDSSYLVYKNYLDTALLYKSQEPNLSLAYHDTLCNEIILNKFFKNSYDTLPYETYLKKYCEGSIVIEPYSFKYYSLANDDDKKIEREIFALQENLKKPTIQDINKLVKMIETSNNNEIWKLRRLLHVEFFNFINNKDTMMYKDVLFSIAGYINNNTNIRNDSLVTTLYSDLSKGFLKIGNKEFGLKYNLYSQTLLKDKIKANKTPYSFEFNYYNDNYKFYNYYLPYNNVLNNNLLDKYYDLELYLPINKYPEYQHLLDTSNTKFSNYEFMLQYLCLEYKKIITSSNITQIDRDKISTYIVYRILHIYNLISPKDKNNLIVGAQFKADALNAIAIYLDINNPNNKMAILKYRQDAVKFINDEEDNPEPYNKHLSNYILYLQSYGYFAQARKLIDAVSMTCVNKPDFNLIGTTLYPLFKNYFLQKHYNEADSITNWTYNLAFDTTIKIDKSQFGTSYNQQKYDWAVLRKDTITMERFKPYINNNYIPIDEFAEIVNIEANVKAEYSNKQIQLKNDSLEVANTKLKEAIKLAEANEKEAKRQKDNAVAQKKLAEKRLDTIKAKESTIQAQLIQLKKDSIKLVKENALKENALSDALRQKGVAEIKTKIANRNQWIAICAGAIAIVAALTAFYFYIKTRKSKRELSIALNKLKFNFLDVHNFKGISFGATLADDILASINTDQHIQKIESLKVLLSNTKEYSKKLYENLTNNEWSTLEKEIKLSILYFRTARIADDGEYKLKININGSKVRLSDFDNYKLPTNILQPFIENSIKYSNIKSLGKNGIIKLDISEENNQLIIKIIDNGIDTNDNKNILTIENERDSIPSMILLAEIFDDLRKNNILDIKMEKFKPILKNSYKIGGEAELIIKS